jgi:uncharacterized peroxidase-related enzyme
VQAHAADLRAEVHHDELVAALSSNFRRAPVSPSEMALLEYAHRLTAAPASIRETDVGALREAGWTDRAISDAVQIIGYFNYINRVADGLGVDLEPEMTDEDESGIGR